jgi:hypothetical protein
MGGGDVLTRALTALAQFLVGLFGIAFIIACVVIAFLAAAARMAPPSAGFVALFFGAAAFTGAYFVNTFIGA